MLRQVVDFKPRNRFLVVPVAMKFLDFWPIDGDDAMARHALLNRGDTGAARFISIDMTKRAREANL